MKNRDRFFNPRRQAKSSTAKAMMVEIINQLTNYEKHKKLRKRSRKLGDEKIFKRQIEAVVCEAIHRYLIDKDKRIAISLSNRNLGRKDAESEILNNTLSQNIKNLASPEMAFLELELGNTKTGNATTFWAGKRLITRIIDRNLSNLDISIEKSKKVLELRDVKTSKNLKGKLIRFIETELTRQYQDEMEQINSFLSGSDIQYHGNKDIDDTRVELKRVFNNRSFEEGGRLYGGFWISMKSDDLRDITIDDEFLVSLDYGQTAVRLAYSLAKASIHFDDGYLIPDRERAREVTKRLINVMLNTTSSERWRVPKSIKNIYKEGDIRSLLIAEIKEFHKPIAHLFGQSLGMKFMFLESEILIDVLLELNQYGIIALPIHDAILVKKSNKDVANEVMLKIFKQRTNVNATVSINMI